jgi:alcohol dehydrogenase class IV
LAALNHRLGVPSLGSYLASHRVRFREVTPKMALDALASGSPGNNPVVPSADQIAELYLQAW